MRNEVKIFVHGSCHFAERENTEEPHGNGGYGVVINRNGKKVEELSEGYSNTTNSRS